MKAGFSLVLVVGLALAGFAVHATQRYFNQSRAELNYEHELRLKTGPLVQVHVVNKVKNYGEVLTKDNVQLVQAQESALPDHPFQKEEILFPASTRNLRFVSRQIEKVEPVLAENVTEPGKPVGLTSMLQRAKPSLPSRLMWHQVSWAFYGLAIMSAFTGPDQLLALPRAEVMK